MQTINFAIIGYGGIAKTHALAAYAANLKYELPFQLRLTHIVTRNSISDMPFGVINTTDIEEVLKNKDIDFIDVCTPNASHLEIVKLAASYKKAIYCEKPLSSSYKDSLHMVQHVKEYGVYNGVAFNYRFIPGVYLLKKAIENNIIGDIIDFKATMYHDSYLNPSKKGTWRTKKDNGGGALLDLGIHLIDIINYTIGQIDSVESNLQVFFKERTEVDEIAFCNLKLANSIQGRLEVSRIHALHIQPTTIEVFGSKGSLKISSNNPHNITLYQYQENKTTIYGLDSKENIPFTFLSPRESLGFFQDSHTAAIIDFCNQIYGRPYIGASFEDGLRAQKIVQECYDYRQD